MDFFTGSWGQRRAKLKPQIPQGLKPNISNLPIAALKAVRHPKANPRG
jgi:hypothetical protein